ncbi:MAG TPA: hypothetical protein EYQ68_02495 [Cytophagales bacterium]|nr:hypothetical protein [Cytophagales bacterium]
MDKSIVIPKTKKEKALKKYKTSKQKAPKWGETKEEERHNKKLKISDMPCASCQKIHCALHRVKIQHECLIIEIVNKEEFIEKHGLGGGKFKQIESI